ncbi:Uncharacterized protein SCF082_LOCUS22793 [Durusdinium trenchii]|uniref:Tyrosine-protein kinase ephrin type A/B receptor-like domain-containing protein n=1 Tax=Durusdinium trenchii TaxID=1381693 RepID=A0ABP0LI42_9DINO
MVIGVLGLSRSHLHGTSVPYPIPPPRPSTDAPRRARRLPRERIAGSGDEDVWLVEMISTGVEKRLRQFHWGFGLNFQAAGAKSAFDRLQRLRIGGMMEDLSSMGDLCWKSGFPAVRGGSGISGKDRQTGTMVAGHGDRGAYVRLRTDPMTSSGRPATSGIRERALMDRIFLDDYRTYNASRQAATASDDEAFYQPQRYFTPLSSIDVDLLVPCDQWTLVDWHTNAMADNAQWTPPCRAGRWWLSDSCQLNSSHCIPFITYRIGGYVNNANNMIFKANFLNIPIAVGAADGYWFDSNFYHLVMKHEVLYFFFEPYITFELLEPTLVDLPAPDATGSFSVDTEPRIVVSSSVRERRDGGPGSSGSCETKAGSDLVKLAPEVREMLLRMKWSMEDPPWRQGACQWVLSNMDTWLPWIPTRSACFMGQGLFRELPADPALFQFGQSAGFVTSNGLWGEWLSERKAQAICLACPPGFYSSSITDVWGDTAICRQCPPGSYQSVYSSANCEPCSAGSFAAGSQMTSCEKCPQGQYQDRQGARSCEPCAEGRTTLAGAKNVTECLCKEETYLYRSTEETWNATCSSCIRGLVCQGAFVGQLPGYWAEDTGSDFSVFECRDQLQCPGGAIGTCAPGRVGRACGSCAEGLAPKEDGTCSKCGGQAYWGIMLVVLVTFGVIPLVVVFGIFMTRLKRTALSIFMVSIIFGQIVVCLQSLDAIYQLDITWIDPAKAILNSLAIFNLDLDLSCLLPPQDYLLQYVVQLVTYPTVVLVTFLIWWVLHCRGRRVSFNTLVNVHGLLLVAMLTAMSLAITRPLQCQRNPNALFTITSRPHVICWQSEEHQALVALAAIGILAYPVTILGVIIYLTRKYPIWLRSGHGLEVMERYRFLFARFRPERYYYGLILSVHNLLVALIPAALVSFPALQVGIMGLVICAKLVVQGLLWPWKIDLANYNDLSLSAGLLMLLLLASPLMNIREENHEQFVGVLLSIVLITVPLAALGTALSLVFLRLRPQSKYAAFLCHHKAGAGAFCRLFKLVASKYMKLNLFLDSDELDDLARIFDIVSADTKCLVAVLTSELLKRMWCAGEIVSAHKNKVPIIPLYCDKYCFPNDSQIELIDSVWTEEQLSTLTSYGISLENIKAAYREVGQLTPILLNRSCCLEEQETTILQVLHAGVTDAASSAELGAGLPRANSAGAHFLVVAMEEPEAISTGMILQQMVQLHFQVSVFFVRHAEEISDALKATAGLFLLSRGALEDPRFASCLLAAREMSLEMISVNDGSFQFPLPDFYTEVETGSHSLNLEDQSSAPVLAKAFQALLSILALPLTPHGSGGLLERQVAQICQRLASLEDGPRKRAERGADDSRSTSNFVATTNSAFEKEELEKEELEKEEDAEDDLFFV